MIFLQRLHTQPLGSHRRDGADRRKGAGEGRDRRHALQHGDAAHRAIVEERFAAQRCVDDERNFPITQRVADVRPALVDLEEDLDLQTVRALVNGAARRIRVCTRCLRSGKVTKAA